MKENPRDSQALVDMAIEQDIRSWMVEKELKLESVEAD